MSELQKELRQNRLFVNHCREIEENHKKPIKWKPGKTEAQLAYDSGFVDGIDFVLKSLGYEPRGR